MNNNNQIDVKKKYFNKKYFSLKNFKKLKYDFKLIFDYFDKKKIKFTNKKIIDIGCGNASFTYFLKKKFKNNKFFALDNHKELINFNKKNKLLEGVFFYNKSCEKKISNTKYDLITILGTLSLLKDQKKVINNLLKHLNKDGLLIIDNYFNKSNIDVDVISRRYLNNNVTLDNSIYIKSYQETKKFLLKKFSKLSVIENNFPYKINKTKNLNIYTLKINGKFVRVNDLNMMYHSYLLVAKK